MQDERKRDDGQTVRDDELGRVRELAEPLASAHGLELVELVWAGRVLRVIIDRPEPSESDDPGPENVTLDDCVRMSRDLSSLLDAEDFIAQTYNLEVSSPGLDRPLQSARDFRRNRGRLAKVKLLVPAVDGQRVLRGTIEEVAGEGVVMLVDGKRHQVALADVAEAKLVFELAKGKPVKPGRKKAKRSGENTRAQKGASNRGRANR
jgi:ribosome maturation factor RimP